MGFLDKLFGKKEEPKMELAAPLAGEAVSISQVNDPTFSDEILGKGLAIRPTGNEVFAPCDGKDGIEILIHVGLETVNLKGKYYQVHAANGDQVKKGQKLISFDREAIAAEGYDVITPIVICNSDQFTAIEPHTGTVSVGDVVLTLKK